MAPPLELKHLDLASVIHFLKLFSCLVLSLVNSACLINDYKTYKEQMNDDLCLQIRINDQR